MSEYFDQLPSAKTERCRGGTGRYRDPKIHFSRRFRSSLTTFLTILVLFFSFGCLQSRPDEIAIQAVLTTAGNSAWLNISLRDSLPSEFHEALHQGLLCQAIFEIKLAAPADSIIRLEQGILYDIWNQNYQLHISRGDSIDIIYLYNPGSLTHHFARLNNFLVPIHVANQIVQARLTLEVNQIEDSQQIEEWSREVNLRAESPAAGLRFGLKDLTNFYIGDGALLSYQSSWQPIQTGVEEDRP